MQNLNRLTDARHADKPNCIRHISKLCSLPFENTLCDKAHGCRAAITMMTHTGSPYPAGTICWINVEF